MFGMGGSEIIVILIVALLFLGPEKLPNAAKQISKGIRDIKKQSRALQQQIESDEQIGGAIRDLKSALRGEEAPIRPRPLKAPPPTNDAAAAGLAGAAAATTSTAVEGAEATSALPETTTDAPAADEANAPPRVILPASAGESDADRPSADDDNDDEAELAKLIRPAAGTVAKGSEPEHG
jgi:sec-independent protein translocase protein TatB